MKVFFAVVVFIFYFNASFAQVDDFEHIDFSRADKIAKRYEGQDLKNLSLLSYNLTTDLSTDVEKFRAIYKWVCTNIRADFNQYRKVINKRIKYKDDSLALLEWNSKYGKVAFKKLLKQKKTMCTGYAYLIKELSFLADVECKIIDGYGRTAETNIDSLEIANHSWIAVKLEDKWYLSDPTWSSGYIADNNRFIKDYNDGYFLTAPERFALNHYPEDQRWLLNETTTEELFVRSPLVYGDGFKHGIFPIDPDKMKITVFKNEAVSFNFELLNDIRTDQVSLIYYSGTNEIEYAIYDLAKANQILSFKNKFKYSGTYDVHLKIDDAIVATHTIKVINN